MTRTALRLLFWRFFVNFISKLSSGQYWPFSIPWNHVCIYRHNYIWWSTWINGYVILHRTIQEVVIRKLSWECEEVYAASGSFRGEWKEKWVRPTYAKSTPQGRHTRAQPCPVHMIRLSCMNPAARWKRFRNMGRCTYHMKMKFYMETPSLFLLVYTKLMVFRIGKRRRVYFKYVHKEKISCVLMQFI